MERNKTSFPNGRCVMQEDKSICGCAGTYNALGESGHEFHTSCQPNMLGAFWHQQMDFCHISGSKFYIVVRGALFSFPFQWQRGRTTSRTNGKKPKYQSRNLCWVELIYPDPILVVHPLLPEFFFPRIWCFLDMQWHEWHPRRINCKSSASYRSCVRRTAPVPPHQLIRTTHGQIPCVRPARARTRERRSSPTRMVSPHPQRSRPRVPQSRASVRGMDGSRVSVR